MPIDKTQFSRYSFAGNRTTPAMTVTATIEGKPETYRTPPGFRLDAFVAQRHPDKDASVTFPATPGTKRSGIMVTVKDKQGNVVETHEGVYDKVDGE